MSIPWYGLVTEKIHFKCLSHALMWFFLYISFNVTLMLFWCYFNVHSAIFRQSNISINVHTSTFNNSLNTERRNLK